MSEIGIVDAIIGIIFAVGLIVVWFQGLALCVLMFRMRDTIAAIATALFLVCYAAMLAAMVAERWP